MRNKLEMVSNPYADVKVTSITSCAWFDVFAEYSVFFFNKNIVVLFRSMKSLFSILRIRNEI